MDISNIIETMSYSVHNVNSTSLTLDNNLSSNSQKTNAEIFQDIYNNSINNPIINNENNYSDSDNDNDLYSNEEYTDNEINTDTETETETIIDTDSIHYNDSLVYCIEDEQYIEDIDNQYHLEKNTGNWAYAKLIISQSYDNKTNTEWFSDYLEELFEKNNDCFANIVNVYYKYESNCNADIDYVYEFETAVSKYLIENLKIQPFIPNGYIFNNDENVNKWPFKLTVITKKNIYSANRWINENTIGFY